jgi:ABC-type transporter Mla MlaB component
MFASRPSSINHTRCFAHPEACRISDHVVDIPQLRTVVIDMSDMADATTSAFARLVLLRRELRRHGRDLRLRGLRDRAAKLYEISRLETVLPTC